MCCTGIKLIYIEMFTESIFIISRDTQILFSKYINLVNPISLMTITKQLTFSVSYLIHTNSFRFSLSGLSVSFLRCLDHLSLLTAISLSPHSCPCTIGMPFSSSVYQVVFCFVIMVLLTSQRKH